MTMDVKNLTENEFETLKNILVQIWMRPDAFKSELERLGLAKNFDPDFSKIAGDIVKKMEQSTETK